MFTLTLTNQERNTLAAALYFYLIHDQGEPDRRSDRVHAYATGEVPGLIDDISMDELGIRVFLRQVVRLEHEESQDG